jgi:hypothetical protein
MTTKARWIVGIAVVAAVIGLGVGLAAAGDGGDPQGSVGMMGGTSNGMIGGASNGMMGGASNGMMGSGSMGDGMMSAGMATMMAGVDMEAMHDQMMASMAGKVPSDVLARCDALHDQMWSGAAMGGAGSAGHPTHHENAGSTG